jgi:hypothetical protein
VDGLQRLDLADLRRLVAAPGSSERTSSLIGSVESVVQAAPDSAAPTAGRAGRGFRPGATGAGR